MEGGLRLVPDATGDLGDVRVLGAQQPRRELEAPASQVFDRRLPYEAREAVGQPGAGHPRTPGEIRHRPFAGRVGMKLRHGTADLRIAQSSDPSALALRKLLQMPAQNFHE